MVGSTTSAEYRYWRTIEPGMEIHKWEAEKLKSVRANLETALAKAVSLEESDRRNNAGSH